MAQWVKNLNSALINLIFQQKSFMTINIFSSWMSFHAFCSILWADTSHIYYSKNKDVTDEHS